MRVCLDLIQFETEIRTLRDIVRILNAIDYGFQLFILGFNLKSIDFDSFVP